MNEQINIFNYTDIILTTPQAKINEMLKDIKREIEAKGYKAEWVKKNIDPKDPATCFLKNGKLGYKSNCINYQGFFLCGGFGSIQCKCGGLLPGAIGMRLCFSQEGFSKCPYIEAGGQTNG